MMLSPRALQQGWKEELDSNIGQHKEWITKRKLEAVFDAGLPARELEEEVGIVGCSFLCAKPKHLHFTLEAMFLAWEHGHPRQRTNTTPTVVCQDTGTAVPAKALCRDLTASLIINTYQVKRRDGLLSERRRQAARLARWRDTEMKEIFDREARKRFDDQHLQNRRKVRRSKDTKSNTSPNNNEPHTRDSKLFSKVVRSVPVIVPVAV